MLSERRCEIACFGGGGHFRSVAGLVSRLTNCSIQVVVDPDLWRGTGGLYYGKNPDAGSSWKVVAKVSDLVDLGALSSLRFLVTFGGIAAGRKRQAIFDEAKAYLLASDAIQGVSSMVDPSSQLGAGVTIMEHAYVGPNCQLHQNVLINTGAIIEHDVEIESHVHVATGAIVNGGVHVGERSFIGSGAIIFQDEQIPPDTVVPAGSIYRSGQVIRK